MTADTRKRTRTCTRSPKGSATPSAKNGAALGFEQKLWEAADKLRNNVNPAEYKHVVLGLIFLKYISDAFAERRAWLLAATRDPASDYFCRTEAEREACLEDRDEYLGANVFWVPPETRWPVLRAAAKQPDIGRCVDQAMAAIEKENPSLRGVLPKDCVGPTLDELTSWPPSAWAAASSTRPTRWCASWWGTSPTRAPGASINTRGTKQRRLIQAME